MAAMRIVHTSDVHLGKRFPHLSREGEMLRMGDISHVFGDIVDNAIKSDASLFLIAGDLFDNVNVPREIIAFVLSAFGRFHAKCPEAHIVLIPGESELLRRSAEKQDTILQVFTHLSYVHLIGASEGVDTLRLGLPGGQIVVSAAPLDFFLTPEFKSRDLPLVRDAFGVFMIHAHTRRRAFNTDDNNEWEERVFSPVAGRGYKYLALGHSHSFRRIPAGELTAVFPGAPERLHLENDRDKKHFVSVEVTDGPPRMKPVPTRVRPVEYISITCSPGEDKVTPVLESLSGGNTERILYIVLEGQMDYPTFSTLQKSPVLTELAGRFAMVHLDNRLTLVDPGEGYDYSALRVETPADEFRRHVEKEIDAVADKPEEERLLRELLTLGLKEIEEGT